MSTVQNPTFEPIATDPDDLPTANGFINEILHFADCCRTGEEPISSGRGQHRDHQDDHGHLRVVQTGEWVDLDSI